MTKSSELSSMKTISKRDIIRTVSLKKGVKEEKVKKVIFQFFDEVIEALAKGETLQFRGFGTFSSDLKKGRTNLRNPRTGESVPDTEDQMIVKFKPNGPMRNLKEVQSGSAPEHTD